MPGERNAAAVVLDWGIEELLDYGEGDDLIELATDIGVGHSENGAVEKDVLEAGEFGVEAGADLEEAGDAAAEGNKAFGGLGDAAEDFEHGAFAGSVASMMPRTLPRSTSKETFLRAQNSSRARARRE